MPRTRPIVVGIDFTPSSRLALALAMRIGEKTGSAVHAIHVIDSLVVIDLQEAIPPMAEGIQSKLIADAKRAWHEFAADAPGADLNGLDVVVTNRIVGILRLARDHDAWLLVLGAVGDRPPDVGLGTVATACLRKSPADVLLARDTKVSPFRRIIACVDFSPTSRRALARAAEVAVADGAELRVLHLFVAPWHQLHYRAPTPEAIPSFRKQFRDLLECRLRGFVEESGTALATANPICEIVDYDGHRSAIAEYADRIGGDLIVLGTRGRTNLRDILLGSTAEKTLRESRCSVLAVKPAGFAHPIASGEPSGDLRRSAVIPDY